MLRLRNSRPRRRVGCRTLALDRAEGAWHSLKGFLGVLLFFFFFFFPLVTRIIFKSAREGEVRVGGRRMKWRTCNLAGPGRTGKRGQGRGDAQWTGIPHSVLASGGRPGKVWRTRMQWAWLAGTTDPRPAFDRCNCQRRVEMLPAGLEGKKLSVHFLFTGQ